MSIFTIIRLMRFFADSGSPKETALRQDTHVEKLDKKGLHLSVNAMPACDALVGEGALRPPLPSGSAAASGGRCAALPPAASGDGFRVNQSSLVIDGINNVFLPTRPA